MLKLIYRNLAKIGLLTVAIVLTNIYSMRSSYTNGYVDSTKNTYNLGYKNGKLDGLQIGEIAGAMEAGPMAYEKGAQDAADLIRQKLNDWFVAQVDGSCALMASIYGASLELDAAHIEHKYLNVVFYVPRRIPSEAERNNMSKGNQEFDKAGHATVLYRNGTTNRWYIYSDGGSYLVNEGVDINNPLAIAQSIWANAIDADFVTFDPQHPHTLTKIQYK